MLRNILLSAVGVVIAVVVYGYWDSTHVRQISNARVTAELIDPMGMNFDTMDSMRPFNRGQLFIKVRWQQPEKERVAEIYAGGAVFEDGKIFVTFGEMCQRSGSTWLAEAHWDWQGDVLTDLTCFIKLDKELPVGLDNLGRNMTADIDANDQRIAKMQFDGLMSRVYASKVPYRYVTWINTGLKQVKDWIAYPFQRT